jgi:division protein CdvB (Snf7/Vps24/ESCRT-III family)
MVFALHIHKKNVYLEQQMKILFLLQRNNAMTIQEELDQIARIKFDLDQSKLENDVVSAKISTITVNLSDFVTSVSNLRAQVAELLAGVEVPQSVVDALVELEAQAITNLDEIKAINTTLDPFVPLAPNPPAEG